MHRSVTLLHGLLLLHTTLRSHPSHMCCEAGHIAWQSGTRGQVALEQHTLPEGTLMVEEGLQAVVWDPAPVEGFVAGFDFSLIGIIPTGC